MENRTTASIVDVAILSLPRIAPVRPAAPPVLKALCNQARRTSKIFEWTTAEHDHHVFVKKIYFDTVDLDQLDYHPITHKGRFYPDYEQSYRDTCQQQNLTLPEYISPNHYLGHNGIWKLDFEAPELLWIIKEQNPSGIHLEDTIFSTGFTTLSQVKKFFDL